MSNPHRGEVEFTANTKVYTLHFSINAMCELEDKLGNGILAIAELMSDPLKLSIRNARALFWAGLRNCHEGITEVEAGRLMSEIGLAKAMELVAKAFTLAFPESAARPLEGQPTQLNRSTGNAH